MRGEDLTKLARWVVPGWIAPLSFGLFVVVNDVSEGERRLSDFLLQFLAQPVSGDALVWGVLLAASGVPIGFIIYQAYFFVRWNSPLAEGGVWSLLSGRNEELNGITRNIDKELDLNEKWRRCITKHPLFNCDVRFAWRYVELLFRQVVEELGDDKGLFILGRYRYLQEIMHTLGASLGAVYAGFLGYLILWEYVHGVSINPFVLGGGALLMSVVLVYFLEREDRERTLARQAALTEECDKRIDEDGTSLAQVASARPTLYMSFSDSSVLGLGARGLGKALSYFISRMASLGDKLKKHQTVEYVLGFLAARAAYIDKGVRGIIGEAEDKPSQINQGGVSSDDDNVKDAVGEMASPQGKEDEPSQISQGCISSDDKMHYITLEFPGMFLVLVLFLIHAFLNPRLAPPRFPAIVAFFMVSAIVAGMWLWSPIKQNPPDVMRGIMFQWGGGMFLVLLVILFHPNIPTGFVAALTILLALTLILFRNRREAKHDLLMLQHYTLRRYLVQRRRENGE